MKENNEFIELNYDEMIFFHHMIKFYNELPTYLNCYVDPSKCQTSIPLVELINSMEKKGFLEILFPAEKSATVRPTAYGLNMYYQNYDNYSFLFEKKKLDDFLLKNVCILCSLEEHADE